MGYLTLLAALFALAVQLYVYRTVRKTARNMRKAAR